MRGNQRRSERSVQLHETAYGLGWFSIGLGLAELACPGSFAKAIGVGNHPAIIRALGVREILSGIGILSSTKPSGWLWSRVAGDVMDLSLLAAAATKNPPNPDRLTAATAAVIGATAVDVYCSKKLSDETRLADLDIRTSMIINRPAEDLYRYWRNFSNLPRFMQHLETVRVLDEKRSYWAASAPGGVKFEWYAEIINDVPNETISWRTLPDSDLEHSGSVQFLPSPGRKGTLVTVEWSLKPGINTTIAKVGSLLGGSPSQQVKEELRKFKQLMETGEIPTTVGQPSGRRKGILGRLLPDTADEREEERPQSFAQGSASTSIPM